MGTGKTFHVVNYKYIDLFEDLCPIEMNEINKELTCLFHKELTCVSIKYMTVLASFGLKSKIYKAV